MHASFGSAYDMLAQRVSASSVAGFRGPMTHCAADVSSSEFRVSSEKRRKPFLLLLVLVLA